MGITLLTFNGLFAPLQQFIGWLATAPLRSNGAQRAAPPLAAGYSSNRGRSGRAPAARSVLPQHRPLRVVRVVDSCHAPASAGRMVISGRMADVCAELDRLAALEGERAR